MICDLSKQEYTTRLECLRTLIVKKENEIYQIRGFPGQS